MPAPPEGGVRLPVYTGRTWGGGDVRSDALPLLERKLGRLGIEGMAHLGVVKHRNLENGATPGFYLS